ncbi:eotaxin-like [Micropterus dolomieu]|uniref:eotaxin-like n=1 Tax=Micropterus dolomieu TaxID=147949 RepID=UPI001E8CD53D|nr:eotaxin-like [Micropterus dolomieu]
MSGEYKGWRRKLLWVRVWWSTAKETVLQCESVWSLRYRHTMTSLTFVSLLLLTIMVYTASAQGGIGSCCRQITTTQIHRDRLKSYYKQYKPSCPLEAVVFTTVQGKRLCSDPGKVWTKTSMAYIDGKNWQLQRTTHK